MLKSKQSKNSHGASKKICAIIISIIILFSAISVFAAVEYTPLEKNAFPGVTITSKTSLIEFLGIVFKFGIAIAVVLALVMIIWGGIMYMTTDSWTGKEEGKSKIIDALSGLGLALVSYLILWTINPCLVDFVGNKGCDTENTFLNAPTQVTTP